MFSLFDQDLAQAAADGETLLRQHPGDGGGYLWRGLAKNGRGDRQGALEDFRQGLSEGREQFESDAARLPPGVRDGIRQLLSGE